MMTQAAQDRTTVLASRKGYQNMAAQWIANHHIREITGSNLGPRVCHELIRRFPHVYRQISEKILLLRHTYEHTLTSRNQYLPFLKK
jgi:hypothetical protein